MSYKMKIIVVLFKYYLISHKTMMKLIQLKSGDTSSINKTVLVINMIRDTQLTWFWASATTL